MRKAIIGFPRRFWNDLFDRSAEVRSRSQGPDIAAILLTGLPVLLSTVEGVQRLVVQVVALPSVILPPTSLLLGTVGASYVITARSLPEKAAGFAAGAPSSQHAQYRFARPGRLVAKLLLLLFSAALPWFAVATVRHLQPLPDTWYGYLLDARDGSALQDVRVEIQSEHGVVLTEGNWRTDSYGFYIVGTSKRAYRSSHLVAYVPHCKQRRVLPLTPEHEGVATLNPAVDPRKTRPMFVHSISCE